MYAELDVVETVSLAHALARQHWLDHARRPVEVVACKSIDLGEPRKVGTQTLATKIGAHPRAAPVEHAARNLTRCRSSDSAALVRQPPFRYVLIEEAERLDLFRH